MDKKKSNTSLITRGKTAVIFILVAATTCTGEQPQFPAMFVLGDSLVDNGNNNFVNTFVKANFLPNGIDFSRGPTGRFCNGKTLVDFLGELLGLPYLPAYVNTIGNDGSISRGVNYASGGAGILNETGRNFGDRFTLNQQIANFENTVNQLKNHMKEKQLMEFLANSLVFINIGSNDYSNNYLIESTYPTSSIYTPEAYADVLIKNYTTQILDLHRLGARKFLIAGAGPIGCMPNLIAKADTPPPPGKCLTELNEKVNLFNTRLVSLVDQLNSMVTSLGSVFVYANTFDLFGSLVTNAESYGFNVVDTACCGLGKNRGEVPCLPMFIPCLNRDRYVFWDAYHPTQAVNKILAQRIYNGTTSDIYPMNVQQLAQVQT